MNHYWEIFKIYQVQIQGNMAKMSKRQRIDLFLMINMLRRKRWRSWKFIPVEVAPLWLIPQSIISKVWRFCGETFVEETFFWLHLTFCFPPWYFQTCYQCGSVVKFQKHSSLQNAFVQICEAGKGWKKKAVKEKNLSETCHESGSNSKSEWFGCYLLVPKEGDGFICGCWTFLWFSMSHLWKKKPLCDNVMEYLF